MKRIMLRIGAVLCAIAILSCASIFAARFIYAEKAKMPDGGLHEQRTVSLSGVDQHINIRGHAADHPVVIWLHGGPGSPDTFLTNLFQPALEQDYTFIRWDQRGCGRSYYLSPGAPLSFDALLSDLDDLVDYAAERFHQPIVLAGHSWGTVLGASYASTHPEKIAGLICTGLVVEDQERFRVETAIGRAGAAGDTADARAISAIYQQIEAMSAPRQPFEEEAFKEALDSLYALLDKYLIFNEPNIPIWQALISPDFGWDDLRWELRLLMDFDGAMSQQAPLIEKIESVRPTQFEVPVALINGSEDMTCPASSARDYASRIAAPNVSMQIMEGFGHQPMVQDPSQYARALRGALQSILAPG